MKRYFRKPPLTGVLLLSAGLFYAAPGDKKPSYNAKAPALAPKDYPPLMSGPHPDIPDIEHVRKADDLEPDEIARVKQDRFLWDITLDAYYSSLGLIINFTDEPVGYFKNKSELAVYRDLVLNSIFPRYLVLEASVNPLPVAGYLTRTYAEDFYQRAKVGGEGFNLIRAATLGFDEPYAASVFLGNVVKFYPPANTAEEQSKNKERGFKSNMGYTGYLFSFGNYHLKDNMLIDDNWFETEWKIKGDQLFTLVKLVWSFRIGAKFHENPDVTDVVYLGLMRSRLDYRADTWDFYHNSGFDYRIEMNAKTLKPVRQFIMLTKKWPLGEVVAFSLTLGLSWESYDRYGGVLNTFRGEDNYQIVLRPNIEF